MKTKTVWVRRCQECGHRQRAKEPTLGQVLSESYRNSKCRRCQSEALDYGTEVELDSSGKVIQNYFPLGIEDIWTPEVLGCAEIAIDETGLVLWVERYTISRSFGKGEMFIKEKETYEVLSSKVTTGGLGGVLVEHVVKKYEYR